MKTIQYQDKTIHIVATAHVSKESILEVKETIDSVQPDAVCVELDNERARALTSPKKDNINIKQIIKDNKMLPFLANLILSNYQKQIAADLDTEVGGEMKQAMESARALNLPLYNIDRNIQITMKRIWNRLSFFKKANLATTLFASLLSKEEISEDEVESLKESDLLLSALTELEDKYPELTESLLHERNAYMAEKIKALPHTNIVVVIGAAHAHGVIECLNQQHSLKELEIVPVKKRNWLGYLIPGIILLAIFALTLKSPNMALNQFITWMATSSILATIGALICLAHPLTIVVTLLTTWIGILSPVLAVGFFSGLMEAYVRPPYASEFETLADDVKSIKKWFKNRVLRIILIFFVTSIFSSIGTYISGSNIIISLFK